MVKDGVNVNAFQWMDSKLVNMLSTHTGDEGSVNRRVVDKKTRAYTREDVTQPTVYALYNMGKVGTDRMDQVIGCYYRNSRFRWHVKIMLHMFYMCLMNAWVTYRDLNPPDIKIPMYDFAKQVVSELSAKLGRVAVNLVAPGDHHTPWWKGTDPDRAKSNVTAFGGKVDRGRGRARCKMCQTNTKFRCKECNVALCVATPFNGGTCWTDWHLAEDLN
jgi:hypothetical protein